ncbi:type I-E CRISPR-associated protein Cas7/Cse4/CasC [Marinomonas shanghaiensis]|uniref:type I-E CRISPR-associated protein Cas7/Cse4/CasC n=1 Tax=Marinomonas shanghaiensis TaxID=2202418 RepID=UPI000DBABBA1|nr:type I-E CRISPR-associated protein Cas7/Cse4/CasC [Marinomonas shanghaiensis]
MTNFINFHMLISHSPACLNRDDMNMQKDAVFGGKRRVRISSQSLKRAIRKSDYYAANIGNSSIRTIHLAKLRDTLHAKLADKFPTALIDKTLSLLTGKEINNAEKIEGDAVLPWVLGEVEWFCQQVAQGEAEGLDDKKLQKMLKEQITAMRANLNQGVDVALSGRMATSGFMSELGKVDGALSLAHSITTHTVNSDIDWFTAVDDLQELGSGHLGTQEFSAGVFYRYASLNIRQLQENLGNADRGKVLEIAAHFAHLLATETPNAKQHSFAAFNLADFVMVSFSDFPLSLANAFEQPVKQESQGGYLSPSIKSLNDYWEKVAKGYGLDGATAQFQISANEVPEGVKSLDTLASLKEWILNNGEV